MNKACDNNILDAHCKAFALSAKIDIFIYVYSRKQIAKLKQQTKHTTLMPTAVIEANTTY